ncbi:TPA_asm: hypothetical protein PROPHIFSQJ01-1_43 [Mycobacterium phage prophiFSQJ01-1]|nr:Uncharacterised protein [Mycobacteroides abscessus subsp. abscessus]SIK14240.1 Uncharacterised protein [Mycobacteroides abscessus subsp. abscessus]SIN25362.1 Uncharacterised protein [Mycobacteroides abscessus subsp. abscessus]SLI51566.1 Uncharacterised protein [Mycobacteroides abscessus subsp. abscessus]DAZ90329.1 TPA_asm: hypothetical protein PROPHIFSQJ01-1_43 [Mycobacterium phage prophiFSQJ01-1]
MTTDQEVLQQLDFTPEPMRCECRTCGTSEVGHKGECDRNALYSTEIHAIDHCNEAGLTQSGGVSRLLCHRCAMAWRAHVTLVAKGNQKLYDREGFIIKCVTCQRPLVKVKDLLSLEVLK